MIYAGLDLPFLSRIISRQLLYIVKIYILKDNLLHFSVMIWYIKKFLQTEKFKKLQGLNEVGVKSIRIHYYSFSTTISASDRECLFLQICKK